MSSTLEHFIFKNGKKNNMDIFSFISLIDLHTVKLVMGENWFKTKILGMDSCYAKMLLS